MRAISVLSLETGTSTRWCLAAAALRRRVRKSAIGSVCMYLLSWHRLPRRLPAGFHDTGDFSLQRHTAEVAHAREHHVAQAVQKFVHVVAAQRHRAPDRHALANLEIRNGFLRSRNHGFLPGDLAKLHRRGIQKLGVLAGFAETDVDRDFLQLGHGHHVLPAKALHQRGHRLRPVFFLQSALHRLLCPVLYLSSAVWHIPQMRTFVPSGKIVWPIRVCLPQLPQTTITFETLIPASFSTIPPLMFFEGLGRVCRLMMPTCSTTTVFFFALIASTRPLLPASFPAITLTLSPLRI